MRLKQTANQRCRKIAFALLFIATHGLASASEAPPDFTSAKKADPEYDQIYPYYVEVCAVSRIQPLNAPEGGGWGHALMYLKGACIDKAGDYPTLRMCGENEVDLKSPDAGAGVSVDKMFKTVNWMAVPGKRLFYHGNLDPGNRLKQEHFEAAISEAVKQNLFLGIEFHERYMAAKPPAQSAEAWVARQTIGTNYAIQFGRTSLCARLPITRDMTQKILDYLNTRNHEIFSGKTDFRWSAYYDNCAHTVHNALAAAGIWEPKSINQFRIKQFFNRAIPANEFAEFAFLGKKHPGALLKIISPHEPNDLFATEYELFVLEGPVRKPVTKKVRKMFSEPRHTDLRENLLHFKERYESILRNQTGRGWRLFHSERSELAHEAYLRTVEKELADIRQKLQELAA